MKTVYLVRHAKSSWSDADLSDFERPLNERGKKDAPLMAERLRKKVVEPMVFISSPAKRAASTAKHFAKAFGYSEKKIDFQKKLYHANPSEILKALREAPDDHDAVILFGHNPGMTDLANDFNERGFLTDNIPTCGIVAYSFDVDKWKDLYPRSGKLLFFDYPKNNGH